MNILCTFGGKSYDDRIARTVQDAPGFGVDKVLVYDDKWLVEKGSFRETNRWLWETQRKFGFGWCAWKAYIILDAMARCSAGDVVLYCDGDTVPIADLKPIWDITRDRGVMIFDNQGWLNNRVVRGDCLVAMGLNEDKYRFGKHVDAKTNAWKVGDFHAYQMLVEWWAYSINPLCQQWEDYGPSKYATDGPEFHQHRTEQAVLSLLANKYGVQVYRQACQWGWPVDETYCAANNVIADAYPQLFDQQYCQGDRSDLSGSRFRNVPLCGGLP